MDRRRDNRIDRHDELITKLIEQQIRTEEQIQHVAKSAEKTQEGVQNMQEVVQGHEKILSAMGVRLSMVQWIGITVGGSIIVSVIGFIVNQLLHK